MGDVMDFKREAARRDALHSGQASHRPLSSNYEEIGLRGEHAFGALTGIYPDTRLLPGGDGGVDFNVPLMFRTDVKSADKPYNLLLPVEERRTADIYVLTGPMGDDWGCFGWEWGRVMRQAPTRVFSESANILNHYIPAGRLRPMSELTDRLGKIR